MPSACLRSGLMGCCCWILEHIADDVKFLREMADSFPSARGLILTVPARSELWSNYDDYWGHHRRYNRASLADALDKGGFSLVRQRYFFHESEGGWSARD